MTAVLGADAGPAGAPEPRHVPLLTGGAAARGRRVFEVRELGRPTAAVDRDAGHYLLPAVARGLEPDAPGLREYVEEHAIRLVK
jgi:hypothetical protein